MFESFKDMFGRDRNKLPKSIKPRILEITDFDIDFQILQDQDGMWSFYIEIYPQQGGEHLLHQDQYIENIGNIELVEQVDGVIIPGKEKYTQWEYAAETAVDVIELLGFVTHTQTHVFEIGFWNNFSKTRDKCLGQFDGNDFRLVPNNK